MAVTAEVLLVIECLKSRPTDETNIAVRKYVCEGITWLTLIQFAIVHGVLPVVASTLKVCSSDLLPGDVQFQFDRVLARAESRNQHQWSAMARVMQAFTDQRVRLLAYKGPALTRLVYGDLRLRESHDIDLWTSHEDIARAGEILRSIGYIPAVYEAGRPVLSTKSHSHHYEFISADGTIAIDLQNPRSHYYFNYDFNELWERRSVVANGDWSVPTLSKEDYLLALAVHGEKHSWRRLNWIADVDRLLLSSSELPWDAIFARARRWRCHRRLCSALAIRSRLFDVPADRADVARYLSDWTTERVLTSVLRPNISTAQVRTLRTDLERFLSTCHLIDRPMERLDYLCERLRPRVKRLPSTVRKRIQLSNKTVVIGGREIQVRYPRMLFKVEIDTKT